MKDETKVKLIKLLLPDVFDKVEEGIRDNYYYNGSYEESFLNHVQNITKERGL